MTDLQHYADLLFGFLEHKGWSAEGEADHPMLFMMFDDGFGPAVIPPDMWNDRTPGEALSAIARSMMPVVIAARGEGENQDVSFEKSPRAIFMIFEAWMVIEDNPRNLGMLIYQAEQRRIGRHPDRRKCHMVTAVTRDRVIHTWVRERGGQPVKMSEQGGQGAVPEGLRKIMDRLCSTDDRMN